MFFIFGIIFIKNLKGSPLCSFSLLKSVRGGGGSSPPSPPSKTATASNYILIIDANILFGGIMKHCPLPFNDFSIVEKRLEDILLTSETSGWDYIVEVSLTIPEESCCVAEIEKPQSLSGALEMKVRRPG